MLLIGIDNGVTGSVGIFLELEDFGVRGVSFPTPVHPKWHFGEETFNKYTRFDGFTFLKKLTSIAPSPEHIVVYMERPMLGSGPRFHSSISAAMCHADQTTHLTYYAMQCGAKIEFHIIDSKEWQAWIRKRVPKKYRKDTKVMSTYFAKKNNGNIMPDGDGFCIAYWAANKHKLIKGAKECK